jgi:hypothetical protein
MLQTSNEFAKKPSLEEIKERIIEIEKRVKDHMVTVESII